MIFVHNYQMEGNVNPATNVKLPVALFQFGTN